MDLAELLLEATHDAVYLCESRRDAGGVITDLVIRQVNAQGLADVGTSREALVGKGAREVFRSVQMLEFVSTCIDVATRREAHEGTYVVPSLARPGKYLVRVVPTADGVLVCTRFVEASKAPEVTQVKRRVDAESSPPGSAGERGAPPSERGRGPRRAVVLVVDDEAAIRRALGAMLGAAGYDVLEAGDGRDALEVLETRHVDVVLSDVRMPRMDGLQLAEHVAGRWPALPVFLLSGWTSPGDLVARGLDGARLLEKPIDAQALIAVVASVAGGPTGPGGRRSARGA